LASSVLTAPGLLLAEQRPRFGGLGVRFEQGGGDLT
jgi:hypothetical protein